MCILVVSSMFFSETNLSTLLSQLKALSRKILIERGVVVCVCHEEKYLRIFKSFTMITDLSAHSSALSANGHFDVVDMFLQHVHIEVAEKETQMLSLAGRINLKRFEVLPMTSFDIVVILKLRDYSFE